MELQPKIIELLKKRGISGEADMEEFLSEKSPAKLMIHSCFSIWMREWIYYCPQ